MKCPISLSLAGCFALLFHSIAAITYPPFIAYQTPNRQVIYDTKDSLQLICVADANPPASYRWEFNGKPFLPSGTDNDVVMLPRVGTLLFNRPGDQYAGFFKCFASNDFGVAVADTVQLITAHLDPFPQRNTQQIRRTAGHSLRIICARPKSFPEATILWSKRTSSGSVNVDYDDRVTIDPDGGINFAFVQRSDMGIYTCQAHNSVLDTTVSSRRYNLTVSGTVGDSQFEPKKTNWVARSATFLRGREARIKCMYAGRPAPGVKWRRTDQKEISSRAKIRSYGLELFFESIEYEDAAHYECDGFNSAKPTPVKTTVIVTVNGHVHWIHKPQSVTKEENATVTFMCKGEGRPIPDPPKWFINGKEIKGNSPGRSIGDEYGPSTTFTVSNIKRDRDTMAIQCNITNHLPGSWVHSSFYLNVQSEKPTISQFDIGPHKWAVGLSKNLTCKVFGAPTPIISWKKDEQSLTGGRFVRHQDGTLEVNNIGITDAGKYVCSASNTHGTATMSTTVLVRRNTRIKQAPKDLTVTAGTQAKFVCSALTDPDEDHNLVIQWLEYGRTMNYSANNRVYRNVQDNSLQIAGPLAEDSGSYTCRATNGIDYDEATATLRVQDRPERPIAVSVEECRASEAKIKWTSGMNNNAPLTNFIVQYQTALDRSVWYTAVNDFPPKNTEYVVKLTANNEYRFRVLAENKVGVSDPSAETASVCTTIAARPAINPRGVRTLDEGENKLVITWQPISPVDFGGSSFSYNAYYHKVGQEICERSSKWCVVNKQAQEGTLGRPGELNIIEYKVTIDGREKNVGTYEKYNITVESHNADGPSTADRQYVIGYSGEGNPKQVVNDFRVKLDLDTQEPLVFSDNATFVWDAVTESASETQGFFRGYMIRYEKLASDDTDERLEPRSVYIVLRDVTKEGINVSSTKLEKNEYGAVENDDGTVTVTITHLPPNSQLKFEIAVINKRRFGTLSPSIDVVTKEGAPGPVQQLEIAENGPTHVRLKWQRPLEPNGVLTRYMVGYKTLNGLQLGPMQYPELQYVDEPSDPEQEDISAKVTGLKPLQMFRFYVWAYTAAGQGSEYFIDDSTVAAGYPNPPTIRVDKLANSTLNVSWTPAQTGVPANVFYVQYKQESAIDQWQRTGWETNRNYIIVSNFKGGWRYEIRVVASNGGIYETGSESVEVYPTATSRASAEATDVFTSSWFIGLLTSLIMVSIFFAFLCLTQKNMGGNLMEPHTAEETEKLKPYEESTLDARSARGLPEHGEPSERYAPSHFSHRLPQHGEPYQHSGSSERGSAPSERYVGSQPPPQDEYMQDDPNKYGEEGSFIGQYREKKELPNLRPRNDDPQPQPRPRLPPTESSYSEKPIPERRSGYTPRGGYASRGVAQPRQAAAQQPRNTATESSDDYRPQFSGRPANYSPNTRYQAVPAPSDGEMDVTNDTVV